MKPVENFHAYAQHWRARVAQVQPSLSKSQQVSILLSMLASPFYKHLIRVTTNDFAVFVQIGQRVEDGIRTVKVFDYIKLKIEVE